MLQIVWRLALSSHVIQQCRSKAQVGCLANILSSKRNSQHLRGDQWTHYEESDRP